ncbi:MAG: RimK family alpha-L-glutamate ligase [Sphingobacteriales bacterium]
MKIAFISYKVPEKSSIEIIKDEDAELILFLSGKGIEVERLLWDNPEIDWSNYDLVVLKSPWGYHNHIERFEQWLDELTALNVKLLNPAATVKWNSDKHYLKDIAAAGLNVIPTIFLEKGGEPDLLPLFDQFKTKKIIIKPCVSAGAKNTITVTTGNFPQKRDEIKVLLSAESFMVQPFMEEIFEGEWSFLFFNGKYSHSVLKVPKEGDFRVQQTYGGSTNVVEPSPGQINEASAFVNKFATDTLYARVDGLVVDGKLMLMELELIEPYLFMGTNPGPFENYYNALSFNFSEPDLFGRIFPGN